MFSHQGVVGVVTRLRNENDRDRARFVVFQVRFFGNRCLDGAPIVVKYVCCPYIKSISLHIPHWPPLPRDTLVNRFFFPLPCVLSVSCEELTRDIVELRVFEDAQRHGGREGDRDGLAWLNGRSSCRRSCMSASLTRSLKKQRGSPSPRVDRDQRILLPSIPPGLGLPDRPQTANS